MKKLFYLTVLTCLFSVNSWSQKSAHPYYVNDSTKYRGFGVGLEFYSGHEKFSDVFKLWARKDYVYNHGYSLYASYFNLNQNSKIKYYIDGGIILWFSNNLLDNYKLVNRSESLQLTGIYKIGKFGIIGRAGSTLNHDIVNKESKAKITPSYGVGLSFPVPLKKTNGFNGQIQFSKINNLYTFSGTIIFPIIFIN